MALTITPGAPTILIRRKAYESSGLERQRLDEWLGLTPDEFRVEHDLVAIGPIYSGRGDARHGDAISEFIAELERIGLVYFDDFFELSGNWPDWLSVHASV